MDEATVAVRASSMTVKAERAGMARGVPEVAVQRPMAAIAGEEATAVTRQRPYTAGCKSEHRPVCFDKPAGTR